MRHRLLKSKEIEGYRSQISAYHPNGQVVVDFARSKFAVLAGPTGAGKDTIRNLLVQDPRFAKVLSTTSRPARPGEIEGEAYHFKDLKFFDKGMEEQRFLQIALVHNQQLSCLDFSDVESLPHNQIGLSILIVQTELELRHLNPDLKTIFIVPPSLNAMVERMSTGRKIDDSEMQRRLVAGKEELEIALRQTSYFCVTNDELDRAVPLIKNYLVDGKFDIEENERSRNVISNIIEEFK